MRLKASFGLTAVLLTSLLAVLPSIAHADTPNAIASQFVKYGGKPILGPTAGSWDADYTTSPRVLFNGTVFRMWYEGGSAGATGVGYATSSDGISWTKHGRVLAPGQIGAWDSATVEVGSVFWNGTMFLMWYRGSNSTSVDTGAVGLATSKDGLLWTKYSGNPILNPTAFGADQKYVASPYAFRYALRYTIWYTGRGATQPSSPSTSILSATSNDGIHWLKSGTAALSPSTDTKAWDSGALYSPSVIYDGTNFELWYSALDQSLMTPRIGLATSPDGATWTRSPMNPMLSQGPSGSWDSAGVEQPSVIITGNSYMLYYDGLGTYSTGRIGLARAPQSIPVPEFPAPSLIIGIITAAAFCILHQRKTQSTHE